MNVGLCYADRRGWTKWHWVDQAFRNLGHTTRRVRPNEVGAGSNADLDLILFEQRTEVAEKDRNRDRGRTKWVQWWFDLMALQPGVDLADHKSFQYWLPTLRAMDVVLVKERGMLDHHRDAGVNAVYCDQACPSHLLGMALPDQDTEQNGILMAGQMSAEYRQRRQDVTALSDAGFSVTAACYGGNAKIPRVGNVKWIPPVLPDDLPALVKRHKACLDVCMRHDVDGYWSDRLWLMLGMGAMVLRRYGPTPSVQDAIGMCHLIPYGDDDHLVYGAKIIRDTDPDRARELGEHNVAIVRDHHTYERRITDVIEPIVSDGTAAGLWARVVVGSLPEVPGPGGSGGREECRALRSMR